MQEVDHLSWWKQATYSKCDVRDQLMPRQMSTFGAPKYALALVGVRGKRRSPAVHCPGAPPNIGSRRAPCRVVESDAMLATETSFDLTPFVTTLHFCRWCREHTRHELHGRQLVCLECVDQVLLREFDWD